MTVKETPEIIAISETKLDDQNIYNISIPGYVFLNTNSPTRAGGVGLYISKELTFIRRRDLERGDSCWCHCLHFCSFAYDFAHRRKLVWYTAISINVVGSKHKARRQDRKVTWDFFSE